MVERQHFDHQDFKFPVIFITSQGVDYERMPGGYLTVNLNILLVGYVQVAQEVETLADELEFFLKDTLSCLGINPTLLGTVNDLIIDTDKTSGNFLYPQAYFTLPIRAIYQVNNLTQV